MTIAKQSVIPQSIVMRSILTDRGPVPGTYEEPPSRYPVMLFKDGVPFYGHVVSHLSLQDWCQMHGYKIGEVYSGTRQAFENERTDLF
jgi:hypothetical protein